METNYFEKTLMQKYTGFLTQIRNLVDSDLHSYINELQQEKLIDMVNRITKLNESLEDDNLFNLFRRTKIKLFSSKNEETMKVSESLFGNKLTLKYILNNRSQKNKNIIWNYLHLLYILRESMYENGNNDRIDTLSKLLKESEDYEQVIKNDALIDDLSSKVKKDVLNVDVNDTTNNLIDDIVKSFQTNMNKNSDNPFDCILEITQQITDKYQDKINSGEVELDKLMGSITKTVPGVEGLLGATENPKNKEKVIIDEKFSTSTVDLGDKNEKSGFNLGGMMKMMNSMTGGDEGGPNLSGLMGIMGKLNNVSSQEEAENLKKEMDNILEKDLGMDISKLNETISKLEDKTDQ
jgi:hypothetical protein